MKQDVPNLLQEMHELLHGTDFWRILYCVLSSVYTRFRASIMCVSNA
jgi:hypothetical protein